MKTLAWLSLALLLASGAPETRAHEAMSGWSYPVSCCSGVDCAQIDASAVTESRDGYVVTIRPGGHPMWPASKSAPITYRIPYREGTPSPDGKFHICINPQGERLCFFAALGGS